MLDHSETTWSVTLPARPVSRADLALQVTNVSRRYGHRYVLRDVSMNLSSGNVLLLIGHNGAGKTTLIRLLAGLLKPTEGNVERNGTVGMVAHDSMLYESLSARENLEFFGRLYGGCGAERINGLLQLMGLGAHSDRRVASYSRGMMQRLTLARALLPEPEILLLDEPMTGLDDAATAMVRDLLSRLRDQGRAVVLATHQLNDVVDLASEVGFLVSGRLMAIESVDGRGSTALTTRYRQLAQDV